MGASEHNRAKRWSRVARSVAPWLVGLMLFLALRAWQLRGAIEGQLPAVETRLVDGQGFSSRELAGRPAVIHFWATWCGVCELMEGQVEALAEDHRVVTVASRSQGPDVIRGHLRERGLRLDAIADPQGELARRFGVRAFPTTFYVDAQGRVRATTVGYTTGVGMRLRLWWAAL